MSIDTVIVISSINTDMRSSCSCWMKIRQHSSRQKIKMLKDLRALDATSMIQQAERTSEDRRRQVESLHFFVKELKHQLLHGHTTSDILMKFFTSCCQ